MSDKTVIKVFNEDGKKIYGLEIRGNILAHGGTKRDIREKLKDVPAGTTLTLIEEKSRTFYPEESHAT